MWGKTLKKIRLLIIILGVVVLAATDLTILLKLFDSPRSANFTTSLVFVNIGIVFGTVFLLYCTTRDKDAVVHGLALYLISYSYVMAEVELAIMFSFKYEWNHTVALISQLALLLTYTTYALLTMIGIVHQKTDRKHYESKVSYITHLKNDVQDVIDLYDGSKEGKDLLDKLLEKITYSDPMSDEEVNQIEQELLDIVTQIKYSVESGEKDITDDVKKMIIVLEKRNRLCQELKLKK